jgi:acetyl-CoA synthetase
MAPCATYAAAGREPAEAPPVRSILARRGSRRREKPIRPAAAGRPVAAAPADPRFPFDAPLHELACDRQPPEREALVHRWAEGGTDRLTFADVGLASRALASRLSEAGVRAGMRVAIALPQSPLAPVAHLACSRVGAVSVPLSPMLGADALGPRLANAGPVLAIAHETRAAAFREADPELPLWVAQGRNLRTTRGALPDDVLGASAPLVPAGLPPGERAMSLFFTSGTTSTPKAVVLPHRVVPGRMDGFLRAHPGFAERDPAQRRFWSPAEWSWIGGLHDALFAPWLAGGCVVSAERAGHFDPAAAARLCEEERVASAFLPPTALRLWRSQDAPTPRLASLHTAGEPLPEAVRAWAREAFGAAPREVYGLTECAFLLVDGRPASGAQVAVFDLETGEPATPGAEGEVRVRGGAPTMMLGVHAKGAVELPLDARGWLRTGDHGVLGPEGAIRVLGRLDDVIKTSGFRVSPGEVETALHRHPAVAACAVVGEADAARGQAIVAFVVPAPGRAADDALAEELRGHVRAHLAPYMVPRRVAFVDALPTTVNGKLLRRELRGS